MTSLLLLVLICIALVGLVQLCAGLREAHARRDFPPTGQIIDVEGAQIHAQVMGQAAGTAPDLVLIHGAGGTLHDWTYDFATRLAPHYRVILFDRPELGHSRLAPHEAPKIWSVEAVTPQRQAALLRAAAAQLNVQSPVVVGHSYGGAVALAWGIEAPDDTAALVLLAGVAQPWPGKLSPFYTVLGSRFGGAMLIPLISAFIPARTVARRVDGVFGPEAAPEGYAAHLGVALNISRRAMRANVRQVNRLRPSVVKMQPQYPTLPMPIEIVHGSVDTTVPLEIHARPLAQQAPHAALHILEGHGHMPHHSAAQESAAAITRATDRAREMGRLR